MDLSKKSIDKEIKKINWFDNQEVFFIEPEKQREVVLNPGQDQVWFEKTYTTSGKISLTTKVFINNLPRLKRGKIIAVTAVPTKLKLPQFGSMPYEELSRKGFLKPSPIGTFFELFEGVDGYRVWTNPSEYFDENNKNSVRRYAKKISPSTKSNRIRIDKAKDFGKKR